MSLIKGMGFHRIQCYDRVHNLFFLLYKLRVVPESFLNAALGKVHSYL